MLRLSRLPPLAPVVVARIRTALPAGRATFRTAVRQFFQPPVGGQASCSVTTVSLTEIRSGRSVVPPLAYRKPSG